MIRNEGAVQVGPDTSGGVEIPNWWPGKGLTCWGAVSTARCPSPAHPSGRRQPEPGKITCRSGRQAIVCAPRATADVAAS